MEKKVDKNKLWIRRILFIVSAYLCVISVGKLVSLHGDDYVYWGGRYFGYNALSIVLFAVTMWLFNRFLHREDKRQAVFAGIGGGLLSAAVVYGAYAHYANDIFRSVGETLQQFAMIIFLSMLTVPLVSDLFAFADRACEWYKKKAEVAPETKRPGTYFLCMWAIIFVSYVPLFLAEWPGNFIFDAKYQMQNVIEGYYNTHHPLIHTLMMGKAYELGILMGNVSRGYQFY
ncbi:MAG: hypothetical protein IKT51_04175, partial [Phascolarctobacterium sp.]|nr:hypothetical protein [Phascolarctobacterium sp.]